MVKYACLILLSTSCIVGSQKDPNPYKHLVNLDVYGNVDVFSQDFSKQQFEKLMDEMKRDSGYQGDSSHIKKEVSTHLKSRKKSTKNNIKEELHDQQNTIKQEINLSSKDKRKQKVQEINRLFVFLDIKHVKYNPDLIHLGTLNEIVTLCTNNKYTNALTTLKKSAMKRNAYELYKNIKKMINSDIREVEKALVRNGVKAVLNSVLERSESTKSNEKSNTLTVCMFCHQGCCSRTLN